MMRTFSRCIQLGDLFVNTVSMAAVVQLGDTGETKHASRALAIQRAIPTYHGDELRFAAYSIFTRAPQAAQPYREVQVLRSDVQPDICIGSLETLGVAASSLLRVGCGGPLTSEARIKHIRQFNDRAANR
jgi:spore germination protein PE